MSYQVKSCWMALSWQARQFSARLAAVFVVAFALYSYASDARADKRVALVVGNSEYRHTPRLRNPRNDATDIERALRRHGFQIIEGFDLDKTSMERKLHDFAEAIRDANVALVFYAGHGLQVDGRNYLVPIDAKLESIGMLERETVGLDSILKSMETETETSLLFIDACRNNPLARNLVRSAGARSVAVGRGLAEVKGGIGTLISFSTKPDAEAADGTERNSPFAGALVAQIESSKEDLSTILIEVRKEVLRKTGRAQVPWEHSALVGRFYFDPKAKEAKQTPEVSEAERAWNAAKDTSDLAVLEAFVERFKDSFYVTLARARLDQLRKPLPPSAREPAPQAASKPSAAETSTASSSLERFDGSWRITRSGQDCEGERLGDLRVSVNSGALTGVMRNQRRIAGTVTASGLIKFSHKIDDDSGRNVRYSGKLNTTRGSGTFVPDWGRCHGAFIAARE